MENNISKLTVTQIRQALKNGSFSTNIITYESPITYVYVPETSIEIVSSSNIEKENMFYLQLWNALFPETMTLLKANSAPNFIVHDLYEDDKLLFLKNIGIKNIQIILKQPLTSKIDEVKTRVLTFAKDINDNYICLEFLENETKIIQKLLNVVFCEDKHTLLEYIFNRLKIEHKLNSTLAELFKNDLDGKIENKPHLEQKTKVKI